MERPPLTLCVEGFQLVRIHDRWLVHPRGSEKDFILKLKANTIKEKVRQSICN